MASDDEVLRAGFAVASDLVAAARRDADEIIDEAERRADLLVVKAERAAAAKQSEAEIYLQKARAVLEIAHQRASNRPTVLSFFDAAPEGDGDRRLDLTADEPEMVRSPAPAAIGEIPAAFDRLLGAAISSAVADSVASTRRTRR